MPYANPEHKRENDKRLRSENREQYLALHRERSRRYREKETTKGKIRKYNREYKQKHRHKITAQEAARKARLIKATPAWLTKEQHDDMQRMYETARKLSLDPATPRYHVDHIIPLRSPVVCGLHVSWNLQIITEKENIKKSNKLMEPLCH